MIAIFKPEIDFLFAASAVSINLNNSLSCINKKQAKQGVYSNAIFVCKVDPNVLCV